MAWRLPLPLPYACGLAFAGSDHQWTEKSW